MPVIFYLPKQWAQLFKDQWASVRKYCVSGKGRGKLVECKCQHVNFNGDSKESKALDSSIATLFEHVG